MIVFDQDKPDMWGNDPGSPMHGTPPDDDVYWQDRKHPHFNTEVYWAKREAEFWREMAENFWYGAIDGDAELIVAVATRANLYFDEGEANEEDDDE
jgi:hypothetical protein